MILDNLFAFTSSAGDSVTTGTTTSGNIVDIGVGLQTTTNPSGLAIPGVAAGAGARDLGIGDDPALKVLVEITNAGAGGTSIQVNLQAAPDNGSGAPGAFATYLTGPVIALANLQQGQHLLDVDLPRPPPGQALPRYWQLQYVAVGTFSPALNVRGYVVLDRWDQIISPQGVPSGYPPGITIAN